MKRRMWLAAGAVLAVLVATMAPGSGAPLVASVHFSAAGDFSSSPSARAVFDTIGGLDNDLHLALGDLSYGTAGAEEDWCDLVKQGVGDGYPFELVSGNHESNGQNGNINDFSACLPNQLPGVVGTYGRQYYVDVPQDAPLVRYVMISPGLTFPDSTWNYGAGTARYNWTAQAIDGARTSGIPWVVVGMHKPCLSVAARGCDPGADLLNLLLAKKVDLVLSGHEHYYGRTKQLAQAAGCARVVPGAFDASCVVDSDDTLVKGAGTVMGTAGTGGVGLSAVDTADPEFPYFAATSGSNQNPTFGVLDFTVTADDLTATFARAAGGTFTDSFTIQRQADPPNTAPTAAFTSSCTRLDCTFDARASGDADGTIATYAWDFGDGTSGTGLDAAHAYTTGGSYPVTLTVTDDDGATNSVVQTVSPTEVNQGPSASFTASCEALVCSFDGTGSTDPDGTIASYAWDFGDGSTGSGASPTHTYSAAGTYTVELSVSDDASATDTATSTVSPGDAPAAVVSDQFDRTTTNGLGSAPVGGAWTPESPDLSVSGGAGRIRIPAAGGGHSVYLDEVSSDRIDLRTVLATDKPASGTGFHLVAFGRRVPGVGDYRARLRLLANGSVRAALQRDLAGQSPANIVPDQAVTGLSLANGDRLNLRLQVTGTSPTTLRLKVWKVGTAEPDTWQQSGTDAASGLQVPGSIGYNFYVSGTATNAPVTVLLDDVLGTTP